MDATFSTYRPGSEVSRLRRGELAPADAHPHVRAVIARCAELREETGGYFDAGEGEAFDPSGLVKGWAVDGALARMDGPACINAGGDVRRARRPAGGSGSAIRAGAARLAGVVALTDAAIATSGAYERGAHIRDPHTGRPAARRALGLGDRRRPRDRRRLRHRRVRHGRRRPRVDRAASRATTR